MRIIIEFDNRLPTRSKRYRSSQKEIEKNIRLNRLQKERDEKARQEALEKRRVKS